MHSANVRLSLRVSDAVYSLAKIGPGYVVAREGLELPRCKAEVIMHIDDREHRWAVELRDGAVPFERQIVTIPCD